MYFTSNTGNIKREEMERDKYQPNKMKTKIWKQMHFMKKLEGRKSVNSGELLSFQTRWET
jgi:hypothetical protein